MIVLAAGVDASIADVNGMVANRGGEVAHVHDEAELDALLSAPRDWQAVLLGPALGGPLALAQRVRARLPDVPIILLAEPPEAARLQHELILSPMRGDPVRCIPLDAAAPRAIEQQLRHAFLRRRSSQAMRSANQALEAHVGTNAPPVRLPPAMEQLIEATPIPLLVLERSGRLVHRNRAARALQPGRASDVQQALPGLDARVAELVAKPDGARPLRRVPWGARAYDVIASPLVLPPSLDATLLILDEVTDLVAAEAARRREAELHATMLAAQSDLGEGVLLAQGDRIVFANDALARMLRRPTSELVGMVAYDCVAPEERARVLDIHGRRREGDRSVPDSYETVFITSDGERVPVELSARVIGGGESTVVLVRDIRRRVAMQQEVERTRAGLAQLDKLATIGSLVSGLAHEIRTPLAAIMNEAYLIDGQIERALAAPDPRAELAEARARIAALNDSIERIRRLMSDMRSFMRGETPQMTRTRLDPCVEEAVRLFAATQRGAVRVVTDLASSQEILADAAQLQQIVINLLQNAAEASPSGGEVRVETRDEADAVVVAVVDRGAGIPPEIQARMFEAFVSTKSRGSGLGLTIVRRLTELHRARIQVESALGKGTRFEIRFPRATSDAA